MDVQTVNEMFAEYAAMDIDAVQRELIVNIEHAVISFEYGKAVEKIDDCLRMDNLGRQASEASSAV
jgi:hypothetical protein